MTASTSSLFVAAVAALLASGPKTDVVTAFPSAVIDPGFGWYSDRTPESLAEEISAKGFKSVRCIVVRGSQARPDIVKALQVAGIPVVMMTFGNGTYDMADLPQGWEQWKMKLRANASTGGFTYLCLNEPAFRKSRKDDICSVVKRCGFDAVEIAETFWPAYKGAESDSYGCLCGRCSTRFAKETGLQAPDFVNQRSPRWWKTDTSTYRKWVDARARWATDYVDDLLNSPDGIRKRCPGVKVLAWGIASRGHSPETMREWEGTDGTDIVKRAHPDGYVVQTDWPDWILADLPPDYCLGYGPYIQKAKLGNPDTPVLIQTDLGSQKQMRRSPEWMSKCSEASMKAGAKGVFGYMMSLGMDIYEGPIKVLKVRDSGTTVRICLNKWPDISIEDASKWTCQGASLLSAKRDGCTVVASLADRTDKPVTLTWKPVTDDVSRRFFRDTPPSPWGGPATATVGIGR